MIGMKITLPEMKTFNQALRVNFIHIRLRKSMANIKRNCDFRYKASSPSGSINFVKKCRNFIPFEKPFFFFFAFLHFWLNNLISAKTRAFKSFLREVHTWQSISSIMPFSSFLSIMISSIIWVIFKGTLGPLPIFDALSQSRELFSESMSWISMISQRTPLS